MHCRAVGLIVQRLNMCLRRNERSKLNTILALRGERAAPILSNAGPCYIRPGWSKLGGFQGSSAEHVREDMNREMKEKREPVRAECHPTAARRAVRLPREILERRSSSEAQWFMEEVLYFLVPITT